jgi:hypothetical protein
MIVSFRRQRRRWALLLVSCVIGLGLAGCARARTAPDPTPPATLRAVPGTTLHDVTLSAQALADLGLRTTAVRAAGRGRTAIPLSAVIYDPEGRSWTYVAIAARTFVRRPIAIVRFDGETVFLGSGPPVGAPVVTVGAPELLGAEYGVGEE